MRFLGYYLSSCGYFLPTFRDNLSVTNYHYSLRDNPEQRTSHLLRGGSPKSRKYFYEFFFYSIRDIFYMGYKCKIHGH